MRKKIALAAVLVLLIAAVGYGTYAYMTASADAKNIITAGTVKIRLKEAPDKLRVMPATEVQREIIITNIGNDDCYVRVRLDTALNPSELTDNGKIRLKTDDVNWKEGNDGFWYYSKKLAPGEATTNLLTGIVFDKTMGNEYQNADFKLKVTAQAVQAANNAYDEASGSVLDIKGWPAADK